MSLPIIALASRLLRVLPGILTALLLLSQAASADDALTHLEQGRAVYNFRCYFCHGYSGDARTLAARFLVPPPRDFTQPAAHSLTRKAMLDAVTHGRPGTAMKPFASVLSPPEIEAVVDFIRAEFISAAQPNTHYHTAVNGWPEHDRYAAAFPFATGQLPVDTPWSQLDENQRRGLRIFLSSCISCHDRSRVSNPEVVWERQALSYPRFGFKPGDAQRQPDAITGATPFARHDIAPEFDRLTDLERRGEALYQANCAFCHAADGTGQNWIGRFMQPHPRNFTDPQATAHLTPERLRQAIRDGLPGTSMPAWRDALGDEQIDAIIAYLSRAFLGRPEPSPR